MRCGGAYPEAGGPDAGMLSGAGLAGHGAIRLAGLREGVPFCAVPRIEGPLGRIPALV